MTSALSTMLIETVRSRYGLDAAQDIALADLTIGEQERSWTAWARYRVGHPANRGGGEIRSTPHGALILRVSKNGHHAIDIGPVAEFFERAG